MAKYKIRALHGKTSCTPTRDLCFYIDILNDVRASVCSEYTERAWRKGEEEFSNECKEKQRTLELNLW